MNKEELLENNYKKVATLELAKIDIVKMFVDSCFDKNLLFQIVEARRSYERQKLLLTQGRTKSDIMKNSFAGTFNLNAAQMKEVLAIYEAGKNLSGPIVTWTLNSDHIAGRAIDIRLVNCSHSDIEIIANQYNITHPLMRDLPHYYVGSARMPEPVISPTPEARVKGLERRISNSTDPEQIRILSAELARLKGRLGVI